MVWKKMSDYVSTHTAAKMLGITPTTIIEWIKKDKLKSVTTLGGHRRIPIAEIEKVKEKMGFKEI